MKTFEVPSHPWQTELPTLEYALQSSIVIEVHTTQKRRDISKVERGLLTLGKIRDYSLTLSRNEDGGEGQRRIKTTGTRKMSLKLKEISFVDLSCLHLSVHDLSLFL